MAAVPELSFLLVSLVSSIHAGHIVILREGDNYTFTPPGNTTSCLISKSVGGENLVLWNTSDLWSKQSSVPGPLKQRLVSDVKTSSYSILDLTTSDSGPYREECWTQGKVTHDNNITITVCSVIHKNVIGARLGETVDLPCEGAARRNQDVQWLKQDSRYETWRRVVGDSLTSVMDAVRGKYQVTKTSALRVSNVTKTDFTDYRCVVMNRQECAYNYRETVQLGPPSEKVYRSVGETTVLPCTVADSTDEQPPRWMKYNPDIFSYADLELHYQTDPSMDHNYSLVFSSVVLNHSGVYACEVYRREQHYVLAVCPTFPPPAVELFSEGDDVTLRCPGRKEKKWNSWFIKSNRTQGRVFGVTLDRRMSRVSRDYDKGTLAISNLSVGDAGEYWCVVHDRDYQCESTERTVLVYVEPFGIYSTFFKVRCSVLSVLLLMLCAALVAVNQRTHTHT